MTFIWFYHKPILKVYKNCVSFVVNFVIRCVKDRDFMWIWNVKLYIKIIIFEWYWLPSHVYQFIWEIDIKYILIYWSNVQTIFLIPHSLIKLNRNNTLDSNWFDFGCDRMFCFICFCRFIYCFFNFNLVGNILRFLFIWWVEYNILLFNSCQKYRNFICLIPSGSSN